MEKTSRGKGARVWRELGLGQLPIVSIKCESLLIRGLSKASTPGARREMRSVQGEGEGVECMHPRPL